MKITPEISELAGLFAADGSMQREHICYWGNITEDKDYYDIVVKELFKQAFQVDINLHEKKSNSVYGCYICNKKIIRYFNENRVPEIIMNSKDPIIWSSFIRGFSKF